MSAIARNQRRYAFTPNIGILAVSLFLLFILAVLVTPALTLLWSSLFLEGRLSLGTYAGLLKRRGYRLAISTSVLLATCTATIGTVLGVILSWNLNRILSERFRSLLLSLATVANNAGGLPLVFGMILIAGTQGMITLFLNRVLAWKVSFELVSFWGLALVYLYFLIPLCILTFLPSLEALKSELREAASVHGARPLHFWRYVGMPILIPPLAACFVLLFVNGFGSFTTPWALVGGGSSLTLITLQIGFLFGEAGYDPQAADALGVIIILIASICMLIYHLLMRRVARWFH